MEEGIERENQTDKIRKHSHNHPKKFQELRYKREETKWEQNTISSKKKKRGTARRNKTDKQANEKQ